MSQESEIVLTEAGRLKLEQRLDYLRNVQRRAVAERIKESKQFGDLAENPEYEDAKTEQALVESQILDLRQMLQLARVLDPETIPVDQVGLGSIVKLTNVDTDDEWEFTLVSFAEADPDNDRISDESPVGEALVGRKPGEVAEIQVPSGLIKYRIDSIRK